MIKKPLSIVTGGAGFIGSHVVEHLLKMNHDVIVLDDLSGGFIENVPKGAVFFNVSILDEQVLDEAFKMYKPDYVFHLAAYAAEGLSHFVRRFNYTNNLVGSVNVINAAVNVGTVKAFVFTSSIAVYGSHQMPGREDMAPEPEDPYGIAKYAVEQDLVAAHKMFGLPYIIFRPHNVYGERQNIGDRYRNVIGIFMNQCLKGEPMTIFGNGHQRRAFSYVGNVARTIAESVTVPSAYNCVFNVGDDQTYSVNHLAWHVANAMELPLKYDGEVEDKMLRYLPARLESHIASADHARVLSVFGYGGESYVDLPQGLKRMARWVKQHGSRETTPFDGIEVRKNLPESWRTE